MTADPATEIDALRTEIRAHDRKYYVDASRRFRTSNTIASSSG